MRICVVDASAIGALLFGEPKAEELAGILEGAQLAAPALLWFELASVCLKKIVAHPELDSQLISALGFLSKLAIDIVNVDHLATVTLAKETGLTTYDASYMWIAINLGGELITLDEKLAKAMVSR